jgi:hypothetical protein
MELSKPARLPTRSAGQKENPQKSFGIGVRVFNEHAKRGGNGVSAVRRVIEDEQNVVRTGGLGPKIKGSFFSNRTKRASQSGRVRR